jgi:hypothetical protein
MNLMQAAADDARTSLNVQIRAHYGGTGTMPDFAKMEPSAVLSEDGNTVVLMCKFPDGFTATAALPNLQARFMLSKVMAR